MIGWVLLGLALAYEVIALLSNDRVPTMSEQFWVWYGRLPKWGKAVVFWGFVTFFGWLTVHFFSPGLLRP